MKTSSTEIDILGVLIHDLGNALRLAVTYARRSANNSEPAKVNEYSSLAYAACCDAENSLKRARFFWQLNTKNPSNKKERISIKVLADRLSEIADNSTRLSARKNPVVVQTKGLHTVGDQFLEVNLDAIELAIWNVIKNALQYSYDGKRILIKAIAIKGEVTVSVTSRGLEIETDELDNCTQFASRGRRAELVSSGRGLGLWEARLIMDAHGGKLHLSSRKGVTTASLIIPLNS